MEKQAKLPKWQQQADKKAAKIRELTSRRNKLKAMYDRKSAALDQKFKPQLEALKNQISKLEADIKDLMSQNHDAFTDEVRSIPLGHATLKATAASATEFLEDATEDEVIKLVEKHLTVEVQGQIIRTEKHIDSDNVKKLLKEGHVTERELALCKLKVNKYDSYSVKVAGEETKKTSKPKKAA